MAEAIETRSNPEPVRITHSDIGAKWWVASALGWSIAFMIFGLITALKFRFPDLWCSVPYLTYGRIRPVHAQGMIFGWLVVGNVAALCYFVPRLTGTKLFSERITINAAMLWNLGVFVGSAGLLLGYNKGKEYEEYNGLSNWILVIAWVMLSYVICQTIARRKYNRMYVALWYVMAFLIQTALVYIFGNIDGLTLGYLHFNGIADALANWFYGHAVVGLIATPGGLAAAYYFMPKAVDSPLYNHKLSIIGFWTITAIYIWNGAHHLIYTAIPLYLQTVSQVFSILLFIPVFTVVTNFFGTVRGHWHKAPDSVCRNFLWMGTLFYLLVCIQGPFQAMRPVQYFIHYTDWVIGHAHLALFGTFSFFIFGAFYYMIPRMMKRPLYSYPMANAHFQFAFWGILIMFISLTTGGLYQGYLWTDPTIPFIETVKAMMPFWEWRTVGGALMFTGQVLFAYNIYKTMTLKYVPAREPVAERAALSAVSQ